MHRHKNRLVKAKYTWQSLVYLLHILDTGELYTWGWNEYGQLGHLVKTGEGQKGKIIYDSPIRVSSLEESYVENVHCGGWTTVVQLSIKDRKNDGCH